MIFVQICQIILVLIVVGQCQILTTTTNTPWVWGDEDLSVYQKPSRKTTKPSNLVTMMQPTPSTAPNSPSQPSPRICPGCSRTPEFHPVCGSDMATYDNPNAVACANMCGPKIEILFYAACQRTIGLVLPSDT